jgi:hypothetical protein
MEYYDVVDGYQTTTGERVRVFKPNEVEIWEDGELKEVIPTQIPFVPVIEVGYEDVPLLDLAKINLNWMNTRSALERYLRIAAVPIPTFYGLQGDAKITVGVDTALTFTSKEDSGFEWHEVSGAATDLLQADLRELETRMAETAVSMVSKKDVAKNATQVSMETSEDESQLATLAEKIEDSLNQMFQMISLIGGELNAVLINKDFTSNILSTEDTQMYLQLFLNGAISQETLLEVLVEGEVLPEDTDITKEVNNSFIGTEPEAE